MLKLAHPTMGKERLRRVESLLDLAEDELPGKARCHINEIRNTMGVIEAPALRSNCWNCQMHDIGRKEIPSRGSIINHFCSVGGFTVTKRNACAYHIKEEANDGQC
jgi:hypothetical protein